MNQEIFGGAGTKTTALERSEAKALQERQNQQASLQGSGQTTCPLQRSTDCHGTSKNAKDTCTGSDSKPKRQTRTLSTLMKPA